MPFHVYHSGLKSYDMQGQRFCLDKKQKLNQKRGFLLVNDLLFILRFVWPQ